MMILCEPTKSIDSFKIITRIKHSTLYDFYKLLLKRVFFLCFICTYTGFILYNPVFLNFLTSHLHTLITHSLYLQTLFIEIKMKQNGQQQNDDCDEKINYDFQNHSNFSLLAYHNRYKLYSNSTLLYQ